ARALRAVLVFFAGDFLLRIIKAPVHAIAVKCRPASLDPPCAGGRGDGNIRPLRMIAPLPSRTGLGVDTALQGKTGCIPVWDTGAPTHVPGWDRCPTGASVVGFHLDVVAAALHDQHGARELADDDAVLVFAESFHRDDASAGTRFRLAFV